MTWPGGDEIAANSVVASPTISASHSLSNGSYGFDLNESNYAVVSTDAAPAWVQIDFGESKNISQIRFRGGPDTSGSHAMVLLTSPDGSTWTTIASWISQAYYTALSDWIDVNRSDVRYIRFQKTTGNNYLRLYYMGVKVPASSLALDPDDLAVTAGISGAPGVAIPSPELSVTVGLDVADVSYGFFLSPDPLEAVAGLSASLAHSIPAPALEVTAGLPAGLAHALPAPALGVAADLYVEDIAMGYFLFPDPLEVTAGLTASLAHSIPAPALGVTAGLTAKTLIGLPAVLGVTAGLAATGIIVIQSDEYIITYLCKLTPQPGSAYSEITIPMSSFQGRFKSGDPSYLSCVIPGGDYAQAISDRNDPDYPPELSVYMVKAFVNGNVISERLMAVDLEDVRIYEGATSYSITLSGHRTTTYSAKAITLTGASYKNLTGGKTRYRCAPDLYLRPGDTVTVNGDTFTADNISIAISVDSQTMEVSEE